jgi:hypothetical protein
VGGCNKTLWGALVHGIMVSCKRQGKRFLDLARRLWQSSDSQAIGLEALPGGRAGSPRNLPVQEDQEPGSSSFWKTPLDNLRSKSGGRLSSAPSGRKRKPA